MKIKLVGYKKQNYDLRSQGGPVFNGKKLHCIVLDDEQDNLTGNTVTTINLSDDFALADIPLEIGKEYICYFNQKKQLDYIKLDEKK